MKPLTQKEFDYYYSKTDPKEPKPVREIHAVRIADSEFIKKHGWRTWSEKTNQIAREFIKKHHLKVATESFSGNQS